MKRLLTVISAVSILACSGAVFAEQQLTAAEMDTVTAGSTYRDGYNLGLSLYDSADTWAGHFNTATVEDTSEGVSAGFGATLGGSEGVSTSGGLASASPDGRASAISINSSRVNGGSAYPGGYARASQGSTLY